MLSWSWSASFLTLSLSDHHFLTHSLPFSFGDLILFSCTRTLFFSSQKSIFLRIEKDGSNVKYLTSCAAIHIYFTAAFIFAGFLLAHAQTHTHAHTLSHPYTLSHTPPDV